MNKTRKQDHADESTDDAAALPRRGGEAAALDLNQEHLTDNAIWNPPGIGWHEGSNAIGPSGIVQSRMIFRRDFGDGLIEVTVKDVATAPVDRRNGSFASIREKTEDEKQATAEECEQRAARRAAAVVRWRCKAIRADRLWTLTYRANMEDFEQLQNDWDRFRRELRKRLKRLVFKYVAVPERQKRGAWHIHFAVSGFLPVQVVRQIWWQIVGKGQGNVDVTSPRTGAAWRAGDLAAYLAKYVTKTFQQDRQAEAKRYWSSRGIEVPKRESEAISRTASWETIIKSVRSEARFLGAKDIKFRFDELAGYLWVSTA